MLLRIIYAHGMQFRCERLCIPICMFTENSENGVMQVHEEAFVRMLQPVGATVKVSFYSRSGDSLAAQHGVLQSLLQACPKPRAGTYHVKTARSATP